MRLETLEKKREIKAKALLQHGQETKSLFLPTLPSYYLIKHPAEQRFPLSVAHM